MTAEEFAAALHALDLGRTDAAKALGVSRRSVHRYLKGGAGNDVPGPVRRLIRLLLDGKITVADLRNGQ